MSCSFATVLASVESAGMNEQKSVEAVVVTETGVMKGRTGYAVSRR